MLSFFKIRLCRWRAVRGPRSEEIASEARLRQREMLCFFEMRLSRPGASSPLLAACVPACGVGAHATMRVRERCVCSAEGRRRRHDDARSTARRARAVGPFRDLGGSHGRARRRFARAARDCGAPRRAARLALGAPGRTRPPPGRGGGDDRRAPPCCVFCCRSGLAEAGVLVVRLLGCRGGVVEAPLRRAWSRRRSFVVDG